MPKGGKPYPKGKGKTRRTVGILLMACLIALPALANRSEAGRLTWSEKPLYFTWDHVGANTGSSVEERGVTALEAMYGSLATITLGANRFEVLLVSMGVGATGEVGTQNTQFDGQFGLVWFCTENRGLCGEFPKIARASNAADNDNRYLFGLTIRPAVLFAPPRE